MCRCKLFTAAAVNALSVIVLTATSVAVGIEYIRTRLLKHKISASKQLNSKTKKSFYGAFTIQYIANRLKQLSLSFVLFSTALLLNSGNVRHSSGINFIQLRSS